MDNVFLLLFLLTPIAWLVGMGKPQAYSKLLKNNFSRVKITGISLLMFLVSFIGVGLTADTSSVSDMDNTEVGAPIEEIVENKGGQVDSIELETQVKGVSTEAMEVNSPTLTPTPTFKPTSTPTPTLIPTAKPIYIPPPTIYVAPTAKPATSSWTCNCAKTCTQISSCSEAYFQLNTCGCSVRDRDNDGIPCESICRQI